MWPGFRELQCVLAAPSVEKRLVPVLHDDSGRLVDMTRVRENLYIGDEYERKLFTNIHIYIMILICLKCELCPDL